MPTGFSAVIDAFWDKAATKGFGGERRDRIEATLMDDEGDGCGGRLAHPHSLDRDTYASAKSSKVIIGCQQNGEQIAKGCGTPLAIWQRANEIVGTPKRHQTCGQVVCHILMSVADRKVMAVRPDAIAADF